MARCDRHTIEQLREFYGLLPQPPSDPFQYFVWEILSRDTVPARRDLAWHALRRLPALTPDSAFRAAPKPLLDAVAHAGAHREERADTIRAVAGEFRRRREVLDQEALSQAGLHRASRSFRSVEHVDHDACERALLFVVGCAVLPVDEAIARVVSRLEGSAAAVPAGAEGFTLKRQRYARELIRQRRRVRAVLTQRLPRDVTAYRVAVAYLRHHAEHTCVPVAPHCGVCPLNAGCQWALNSATRPGGGAP